jgi:hypothetical protein
MNLSEIRDLLIVISGCLFSLVMIVSLIVLIVVGVAVAGLVSVTKSVVQEQLSPTLNSARQIVDDVRGTTSFIADTTVSPILRVYGIIGSIRRGAAALAGFGRKRKK